MNGQGLPTQSIVNILYALTRNVLSATAVVTEITVFAVCLSIGLLVWTCSGVVAQNMTSY
jgi:hypothetical protein